MSVSSQESLESIELSHLSSEQIHQLSEHVPMHLQSLYIRTARLIRKQRMQQVLTLSDREIIDQANIVLQDLEAEPSEQQEHLARLASTASIEALRLVQAVLPRLEGPTRGWALMTELDLKMSIMSDLVDARQVMLSSGLGGQGKLVRLHGFVLYQMYEPLKPYQRDILIEELQYIISRAGGQVESYELTDRFVLFSLLVPLGCDMESLIRGYISSCNELGSLLSDKSFLTNMSPLTIDRVEELLSDPDAPEEEASPTDIDYSP